MKPLRHLLRLSAIVALVIGLRVLWPEHYRENQARVAGMATFKRAREIASAWSELTFTDLEVPGAEEAFLAGIKWSSLSLSDVQRRKAMQSVGQVLRYLEQPTFDGYYRLKTDGLRYQMAPARWATNLLASAFTKAGGEASVGSRDLLGVIWNTFYQKSGAVVPPRITGVALATVKAAISHTNSARPMLTGPVKQGFTIAIEGLEPGFHYQCMDKSPAGPVLLFSFVAKSSRSGVPGPVHVSLFWVESDQSWAPNRLLVDKWLDFPILF